VENERGKPDRVNPGLDSAKDASTNVNWRTNTTTSGMRSTIRNARFAVRRKNKKKTKRLKMSNDGLQIVGGIMVTMAMAASFWNSFLIMNLIDATSFMWSLWWVCLILMIFGTCVTTLSK
jgi:hypothetical protein